MQYSSMDARVDRSRRSSLLRGNGGGRLVRAAQPATWRLHDCGLAGTIGRPGAARHGAALGQIHDRFHFPGSGRMTFNGRYGVLLLAISAAFLAAGCSSAPVASENAA